MLYPYEAYGNDGALLVCNACGCLIPSWPRELTVTHDQFHNKIMEKEEK